MQSHLAFATSTAGHATTSRTAPHQQHFLRTCHLSSRQQQYHGRNAGMHSAKRARLMPPLNAIDPEVMDPERGPSTGPSFTRGRPPPPPPPPPPSRSREPTDYRVSKRTLFIGAATVAGTLLGYKSVFRDMPMPEPAEGGVRDTAQTWSGAAYEVLPRGSEPSMPVYVTKGGARLIDTNLKVRLAVADDTWVQVFVRATEDGPGSLVFVSYEGMGAWEYATPLAWDALTDLDVIRQFVSGGKKFESQLKPVGTPRLERGRRKEMPTPSQLPARQN